MNYLHVIRKNANGKPKSIGELMEGSGPYSTERAKDVAESLEKRGILKRNKYGEWSKRS